MEIRLVQVSSSKIKDISTFVEYIKLQKRNNSEAINNLEWLMQPGYHVRNTGRTTLIALALIERAIKNPNKYVFIVDHYDSNTYAKRHCMNKIMDILEYVDDYDISRFSFNKNKMAFKYV